MSTFFLDCEFDGFGGELITMALVREDGESAYWQVSWTATDPWVKANVLPIINAAPVPPRATHLRHLGQEIAEFLAGDEDPTIVADWPDDIRYFCQAVITGPGMMVSIPRLTFKVERVDAYPTPLEGAVQHNAWFDAQALRFKLAPETFAEAGDTYADYANDPGFDGELGRAA